MQDALGRLESIAVEYIARGHQPHARVSAFLERVAQRSKRRIDQHRKTAGG
jgi:hypothetical protein